MSHSSSSNSALVGQDAAGHGQSQSDLDFQEQANLTLAEFAANVSGSTAGPGNPGQEEEVVLVCCKYNCGPPQPVANGFKANKHAAWVCKPCYNAQQALASACRKDPGAKEGMLAMQSQDPEQWVAKVRSLRIAVAPGQAAGPSLALR